MVPGGEHAVGADPASWLEAKWRLNERFSGSWSSRGALSRESMVDGASELKPVALRGAHGRGGGRGKSASSFMG